MSFKIVLNPIFCDGRGVCAELLPERIVLDDWGYPIVSAQSLSAAMMQDAKEACSACPLGALSLEECG